MAARGGHCLGAPRARLYRARRARPAGARRRRVDLARPDPDLRRRHPLAARRFASGKNQVEKLARGDDVPSASARTRIGRELTRSMQRLEREVEQRTARLKRDLDGMERALDALPGPVLLLNDGHKVVRANRASENLLGGELEGRELAAVLGPVVGRIHAVLPASF